jgi:DNA polymerase-3 subunit delta
MGLKGEGIAAPVVLWALTRELRLVNTLKSTIAGGASADSLFAQYKLWDSRKAAMSLALQRLDQAAVHEALLLAGRADRVMKGMASGDEWDALLTICASLCKPQAASKRSVHANLHH